MVLPTPPTAPEPLARAANGFADIKTSGSSPGSASFRERVDARKRGNHDEDAIRRAKSPGEKASGRERDKSLGLSTRADGALVIQVGVGPLRSDLNGIATRETPKPVMEPTSRPAIALTDVRVGGAPGEAQVHARIAAGPYAGVEVRAIERNGRVTIELIAGSRAEARVLRAEMGEIREVLAARGLDEVSVDVRSGDHERHERQREAFESSDDLATGPRDHALPSTNTAVTGEGELIL